MVNLSPRRICDAKPLSGAALPYSPSSGIVPFQILSFSFLLSFSRPSGHTDLKSSFTLSRLTAYVLVDRAGFEPAALRSRVSAFPQTGSESTCQAGDLRPDTVSIPG